MPNPHLNDSLYIFVSFSLQAWTPLIFGYGSLIVLFPLSHIDTRHGRFEPCEADLISHFGSFFVTRQGTSCSVASH